MPGSTNNRRFSRAGGLFCCLGVCLVLGVILALTIFFLDYTKDNPRMDIIPHDDLITYDRRLENTYQPFVQDLHAEIREVDSVRGEGIMHCVFGRSHANKTHACSVDTYNLGKCSPQNEFGYRLGEPCIMIKLNQVYGWTPERFGSSDFEDSEFLSAIDQIDDFPTALNDRIRYLLSRTANSKGKEAIASSVWIDCEGNSEEDRKNIGGINYHPGPYFGSYFFPYLGQEKYADPFVMVELRNPKPSTFITVKCVLYAPNIPENMATRKFNILID